MKVALDAKRREVQVVRADAVRAEARYLKEHAAVLERQAEQIERTWDIPAPCQYCTRRWPDEHHKPGCWMLK